MSASPAHVPIIKMVKERVTCNCKAFTRVNLDLWESQLQLNSLYILWKSSVPCGPPFSCVYYPNRKLFPQ